MPLFGTRRFSFLHPQDPRKSIRPVLANLEAVTVSGGAVMLARTTFCRCCQLERIAISSMAIIVEIDGRVVAMTGGSVERDYTRCSTSTFKVAKNQRSEVARLPY